MESIPGRQSKGKLVAAGASVIPNFCSMASRRGAMFCWTNKARLSSEKKQCLALGACCAWGGHLGTVGALPRERFPLDGNYPVYGDVKRRDHRDVATQ